MGKKIVLLLIVCVLCTTAFSQVKVNEENFPCENFRNWILEQAWGKSGVICDEDIERITRIDVSRQRISDLTGINFFTNLLHLDCSINHLTSLDVSGLTNLQRLFCNDNRLTSLIVSGLINLELLNARNNDLTSLDVSELTNLRFLAVCRNYLTSLDISDLTSLEMLWCSRNQLTSLDVSNSTNLSVLDCSINQLTSLDVSNLASFATLVAWDNQLTSLDVSNSPNFYWLEVQNNRLTSLDVSGLNNLRTLRGNRQNPILTFTNYSVEIKLNNPTNLAEGLTYQNGRLISRSRNITTSPFSVETGNPDFTLSGTLILQYE